MFCNKCGAQLPEDARFCNHCGSPVAQQPNYQQPQYHTAPYTVPLDAAPEVKAQAQQYPNYTVPLDSAGAQQYPQYTAPVDQAQQYPQYTTPVDNAPPYNPGTQWTPAVQDNAGNPAPEVTGSTQPVKPEPVNTPPAGKAAGKKWTRKRNILVSILAVVVVVIVLTAVGYNIVTVPYYEWLIPLRPRAARALQSWVRSHQWFLSICRTIHGILESIF